MSTAAPPIVTYRTVPDVPGLLVGDDGSVASFKPLRPFRTRDRCYVSLDGRRRSVSIRRRILEAFRGPCPAGMEPVSIDGDIGNLALENLRWGHRRDAPLSIGDLPARGSCHGRARLDEAAAAEIRKLRRAGWTHPRLAARFGVSPSTIQALLSGRTWGHVPEARSPAPPGTPPGALLDVAKAAEARALHAAGPPWTIAALARRYGVCYPTMADAIAGRSWKADEAPVPRGPGVTSSP